MAIQPVSKRGENQSADTKFATLLLCDSLSLIESGRVGAGVSLIKRALALLPDTGNPIQDDAERQDKNCCRGFDA